MSSGRLALTVCPHVRGKADLSSATSAADCADLVARWGCVFRAGVSRESLATSALLYLDSNAVLLEVLHTGVTDFAPFRPVAGECLPLSWVYAGGLHVSLQLISVALQWATKSPRTGRKFRVEDSLRDPAVRHSMHMANPAKLRLKNESLYAGDAAMA